MDAEEAIDLLCALLLPARPGPLEGRLAHGFRGGQPRYAPGWADTAAFPARVPQARVLEQAPIAA